MFKTLIAQRCLAKARQTDDFVLVISSASISDIIEKYSTEAEKDTTETDNGHYNTDPDVIDTGARIDEGAVRKRDGWRMANL